MHCLTSTRPIFDLTMAVHPRAVHVEVLRFIKGIRGPRKAAVSRKQVGVWLRRTPSDAVDRALADLIAEGRVSAGYRSLRNGRNTANRAIGYEAVRTLC